ncbi:partial 2,4-dienoyl-CoA reductase, partial [Gammaproteobacteria bacterium]
VGIPLCTTNRINAPEVAEEILASGGADMVSMARPFLADPDLVRKAAEGRADEINTCIACNQACLDHVFDGREVSCLVNPRACRETVLVFPVAAARRRVAVVGAGPAGLACATELAARGHAVDLFEAAGEVGGQFNLAKRVPGKEEFAETLRYFARRIERTGVSLKLGKRVTAEELIAAKYDEVVLATGVVPRSPGIPGQEHPKVVSYVDVLLGRKSVGERVAIVGAGGIGFDVATFLVEDGAPSGRDLERWKAEWGVADPETARGGLVKPRPAKAARRVTLLQRKATRPGAGLAKTTGWIHRAALKAKGVEMLAGVRYDRVDDAGLTITRGTKSPETRLLEVDTVVLPHPLVRDLVDRAPERVGLAGRVRRAGMRGGEEDRPMERVAVDELERELARLRQAGRLDPDLLAHLADRGLLGRLARVDPPAGRVHLPGAEAGLLVDQEEAVAVPHEAEDGALGRLPARPFDLGEAARTGDRVRAGRQGASPARSPASRRARPRRRRRR